MTSVRRDGAESPFSRWIRSHPDLDSIRERLSVTDCDYWIHQYRAHTDKIGERAIDSIMLVELKTFSAGLPFAQRDTLRIVNHVFGASFRDKSGRTRTIKARLGAEIRLVRMFGVFLLQLSGDRPDNSEEMYWHGRRVDVETLVQILRFDVDPWSLRQRSDRRHHTDANQVIPLFGSAA